MPRHAPPAVSPILSHLALVAALVVALSPSILRAQSDGVALGGSAGSPQAPVEVTAERLEVDRESGTAAFSGDVVVTRGDLRLTAPTITVLYSEAEDAGGQGGVEQITASGGVTLVTPDEAAEAESAVYRPRRNEIVMTGNVLLTQGRNTLAGQRLVVDLATGTGRIEGRVRTILQGEP